MADTDLRTYLAAHVKTLLATRAFLDALPGHLPPDAASQDRVPLVLKRMETLVLAGTTL